MKDYKLKLRNLQPVAGNVTSANCTENVFSGIL